jgi:hypothetical protein
MNEREAYEAGYLDRARGKKSPYPSPEIRDQITYEYRIDYARP